MAYEKPNYTQTPNAFFDNHLREIKSLAELKVTLIVLRNTLGWHSKETDLTIANLIAATGLSNRHVVKGTALALERGTIVRRPIKVSSGQSFAYEANIEAVTKGHSSRASRCDQRSQVAMTKGHKPPRSPNIGLKKEEKERVRTLAIEELKDPDTIPGLRNQLEIYDLVVYEDVYADWYAKYEPRGGIGRTRGSKCTLAQYASSIENHFRKWQRNAESRNGNGHKQRDSDWHSALVAPEKPVDYFEKISAQYQTQKQ